MDIRKIFVCRKNRVPRAAFCPLAFARRVCFSLIRVMGAPGNTESLQNIGKTVVDGK
jgi:hypothetical protein